MPRRGQGGEHRPIPELITSLAGKIVDGEIRLPKFQRDFVWSRQQVLDLLDSTAISNQMIADQPPAAYLEYELGFCGEQELLARLDSLLVSPQAYEAAKSNDYARFIAIRADDLLRWAGDLMRGERPVRPPQTDSPEVMRHGMTVEVEDKDTED